MNICTKCGTVTDGTFCPKCGAATVPKTAQVNYAQPKPITKDDLPEQYQPLSAWAYWGLSILYTIPIVGFIFLIIFSFNSSNINRRSFTRSYWITTLLVLVIFGITAIILIAAGGVETMRSYFQSLLSKF